MAQNVNIIGRDSEGNLRALKVNSEGNLEISDKDFATESTLSIIKDNQGRLYGKYGEEWLPILVDSTGRLLLASDVTVNAEGLTVDLGQIKQGPAGTEPWLVQLSGTIVSERFVMLANARELRGNLLVDLITTGGMTESEIRKFKSFKISIISTLDKPGKVVLYSPPRAGSATRAEEMYLYNKTDALAATNGILILSPKDGGSGKSKRMDIVPALEGVVHSNLIVYVTFDTPPTSGSISVGVEMHG